MNPYFKSTKGYNAEVIVAKPLQYTAQAGLAAFVASAVEGELGIFNAKTLALCPGSVTPTAAGTEIFIAQKRDGVIHKTNPFKLVSGIASYTPYVAPVKTKFTIDASSLPAAVKGNVYEIAIIELTRGGTRNHFWNFDETAKAGDTVTAIITRLATRISDVNAKENYAYGKIAEATVVSDDLVLESVDADRYFRVVVRQSLGDAAVVHTTKPLFGSGTYNGIKQVEAEGHIFDGVTTNYPNQNIRPEEFGEATSFAVPGTNYDVVLITNEAVESSPLPMHKHTSKNYIFLALPQGAATPLEEVKYIFGIA